MNKVKISIVYPLRPLRIIMAIFFLFIMITVKAEKDPVVLARAYVTWYSEDAVEQMIEHGIPASVTLAQAIFESRCGSSVLARKSNNHFGIKCHTTWGGDTVVKTDDTLNECFRKYSSVEESYLDHSLFLKSRSRYAHLFNIPVTDYKSWCRGLKAAGYATYTNYAEELIKIIEELKLYRYDLTEFVPCQLILNSAFEIKENDFDNSLFDLKDFAKSDALFINEQDALIQSLELIAEADDSTEGIAEN